VIFDLIEEPIFWINRWFALRLVSESADPWLLAAGFSGSSLDSNAIELDGTRRARCSGHRCRRIRAPGPPIRGGSCDP
jgi:hypothetical protein